jgi:hypothetical protein
LTCGYSGEQSARLSAPAEHTEPSARVAARPAPASSKIVSKPWLPVIALIFIGLCVRYAYTARNFVIANDSVEFLAAAQALQHDAFQRATAPLPGSSLGCRPGSAGS